VVDDDDVPPSSSFGVEDDDVVLWQVPGSRPEDDEDVDPDDIVTCPPTARRSGRPRGA
jgi:hypothetical protein